MTRDGSDKDCPTSSQPERLPGRRKFLGSLAAGAGLAGLAASGSAEEKQLSAELASDKKTKVDTVTAATKKFNWTTLKDRKGKSPSGLVGDLKLSRIVMGGNLIGGWAHARDLIYVSKLVKAYHTRTKIFETLRLGEACGVNTIIINPIMFKTMKDYWKNAGGKMQFISDCGGGELMTTIKKSIAAGASSCYIQGGIADNMVRSGQFDRIAQAVELIRKSDMPAGIGGHKLETIKACVEKGIKPDYWMKTLHHIDYWSAKPKKQRDNIWCEKPKETVEYMEKLPEPWIAFKVLAAGAIHPKVGFKYAFENGADFICVGMYDFQVVEDVNLVVDIFKNKKKPKRTRPWRA
ncbi:MAG: hypothetical protein QGG42_08155 [Phycisphaerae bacterium]|jgi:hypothetical protein|nr:hypothetical protein [Phycisphaerae bacterium]